MVLDFADRVLYVPDTVTITISTKYLCVYTHIHTHKSKYVVFKNNQLYWIDLVGLLGRHIACLIVGYEYAKFGCAASPRGSHI